MPRKTLRRWLPDAHKIVKSRPIRWFGPLLKNPNLFHINRSSITKSCFLGIFAAFLPLPGQTFIAAALALIFRSNLPLTISLIWITNPLTIPPIFLFNYSIGVLLLGHEFTTFHIELTWDWVAAQGHAIWLPLLTGSLVCGLIIGASASLIVNLLWRWTVAKDWENRKKKRREALRKITKKITGKT